MVLLLYFCTGIVVATFLTSLFHVAAFAWHSVRNRLESGASANLSGKLLKELILGWFVLACSTFSLILLSGHYPVS